jgi:hypothetical protein
MVYCYISKTYNDVNIFCNKYFLVTIKIVIAVKNSVQACMFVRVCVCVCVSHYIMFDMTALTEWLLPKCLLTL